MGLALRGCHALGSYIAGGFVDRIGAGLDGCPVGVLRRDLALLPARRLWRVLDDGEFVEELSRSG